MKEELRDELLSEFSDLFPKEDPLFREGSGVSFGIDCGDGWYSLIYSLCKDIREILIDYPELKRIFKVIQVKEKFAGLRFYIGYGNKEIFDRIHNAEEESFTICEFCGRGGKPRWDLPWKKTLCDGCYEKEKERQL